ncbi:MAG: ATP-dependent DNA helicase [Acidiferrobacterales bacterium]
MDIVGMTHDFFRAGGAGQTAHGYDYNPIQSDYASAVAQTLVAGPRLIPSRKKEGGEIKKACHSLLQAPTGSGKTLAYLVPLCLFAASGRKRVCVSTYTLALLRQIRNGRDIDVAIDYAERLTGVRLSVAQRIGRSNYVSPGRAEKLYLHCVERQVALSRDARRFFDWAKGGGLFAEFREVSGIDPVTIDIGGDSVSLQAETALRATDTEEDHARYQEDCGQSSIADVLLTTHHSLLLHGATDGLGPIEAVVSDEADRMESAAESLTGRKFRPLDGIRLANRILGKRVDAARFKLAAERLDQTLDHCRDPDSRRKTAPIPEGKPLAAIHKAMRETADEGGKLLATVAQPGCAAGPHLAAGLAEWLFELERWLRSVGQIAEAGVQHSMFENETENDKPDLGAVSRHLSWSPHLFEGGFVEASLFPLRRYGILLRRKISSWILTSATLSVRYADDFKIVRGVFTLGMDDILKRCTFPPPKNFGHLSLVRVREDAPKPFIKDSDGERDYNPEWADHAAKVVIEAADDGRAMVLTRSFADHPLLLPALIGRFGAEAVAEHVQGERLSAFLARSSANRKVRVILAPGAWEGVEVRSPPANGAAQGPVWMRNLVIPRLPILPPNNHLDEDRAAAIVAENADWVAKLEAFRKEALRSLKKADGKAERERLEEEVRRLNMSLGRARKMDLAGAKAILFERRRNYGFQIFVQGAGRLIRGFHDRGTLWIADPRFSPGHPVGRDYYDLLMSRYPEARDSERILDTQPGKPRARGRLSQRLRKHVEARP